MRHQLNDLGQPIGPPVAAWCPPPRPPREPIVGRVCRIEPLDPDAHATDLYAANALDPDGRNWTYLPYGPFADLSSYRDWTTRVCCGDDPLFHAIVDDATNAAVGVASYMRIDI